MKFFTTLITRHIKVSRCRKNRGSFPPPQARHIIARLKWVVRFWNINHSWINQSINWGKFVQRVLWAM